LLELLSQAHRKFLINIKGSFMHGGWQLFSLNLLVEVEESLLIRWVTLYALASVWRRGEWEKHTCVLAHLAGLGRAWRGEAFAIYFCYESMSNMF
jgi:hypothetical protein